MSLAPGLRATVRAVVAEADTAIALGSGDVPVLGTPRLLALAEAACVAATEPQLDAGQTTVGTMVALEHKSAAPIGTEIVVDAELTEVDRGRLVFMFIARLAAAPDDVVGAGRVERRVVDRDAFIARATAAPLVT